MIALHWIGAHSTKLAATLRAFFYMGTLLQWWVLTAEQLIGIMAFVEAFLYMFVEGNTISKVRMGERMAEVESRVEQKAEQKADAKVAAIITGSGVFTAPNLP